MTIYHPKVGFDIQSVTSAGTDAASATVITINVGETLIFVTGSGGPDGVLMPDMDIGNEVELRPVSNQCRLYLPGGATLKGLDGSTITVAIYVQAQSAGGVGTQLIKSNTSEWRINI
jgi:hypothetical protein